MNSYSAQWRGMWTVSIPACAIVHRVDLAVRVTTTLQLRNVSVRDAFSAGI